MNNKETKNNDLWVKCPDGAIQKIANLAIVERSVKPAVDVRRRTMLAATASAAGVLAFGGVAYLMMRQPASNLAPGSGLAGGVDAAYGYGGIDCFEVIENIPSYIADAIKDPGKVESIKEHLEKCGDCREVYENQMLG